MTIDPSTLQPGDRITIEAEFARHGGDGKHVLLAHGHDASWCSFAAPIVAIVKVDKVPE